MANKYDNIYLNSIISITKDNYITFQNLFFQMLMKYVVGWMPLDLVQFKIDTPMMPPTPHPTQKKTENKKEKRKKNEIHILYYQF